MHSNYPQLFLYFTSTLLLRTLCWQPSPFLKMFILYLNYSSFCATISLYTKLLSQLLLFDSCRLCTSAGAESLASVRSSTFQILHGFIASIVFFFHVKFVESICSHIFIILIVNKVWGRQIYLLLTSAFTRWKQHTQYKTITRSIRCTK